MNQRGSLSLCRRAICSLLFYVLLALLLCSSVASGFGLAAVDFGHLIALLCGKQILLLFNLRAETSSVNALPLVA